MPDRGFYSNGAPGRYTQDETRKAIREDVARFMVSGSRPSDNHGSPSTNDQGLSNDEWQRIPECVRNGSRRGGSTQR